MTAIESGYRKRLFTIASDVYEVIYAAYSVENPSCVNNRDAFCRKIPRCSFPTRKNMGIFSSIVVIILLKIFRKSVISLGTETVFGNRLFEAKLSSICDISVKLHN